MAGLRDKSLECDRRIEITHEYKRDFSWICINWFPLFLFRMINEFDRKWNERHQVQHTANKYI